MFKTGFLYLLIFAIVLSGATSNAQVKVENSRNQNQGFAFQSETLTGDWGGNRSNISDTGIELEAVYTGEVFSILSGGIDQKSVYLDNVDVVLAFDMEKLIGFKSGLLNLHILGNNGKSPTEYAGDFQTISNIDAENTWKIFELWYEQGFLENRFSLKAGLYDLNSEFYALEYSGLFINDSHGISSDFSQSGQNGPSVFPTTGLGIRARYNFSENTFLQAAVLDGVPGDPEDPKGTHIKLEDDDGALIVVEGNRIFEYTEVLGQHVNYLRVGFGYWQYTAEFEEINEINPENETGNNGFYAMVENQFGSGERRIDAFGRIGFANAKYNQIGNYIGFGMVFNGYVRGRTEDQFGIAVSIANNSADYKDFVEAGGGKVENGEIDIDITYNAVIFPWFTIQPDFQYIINPGFDPDLDNVMVLGLRFAISF